MTHRFLGRTVNAPAGAAPTVLVVHGDGALRDMLRDALEWEGYAVLAAENGAQALALVEQAPPALILVDAFLSVMDGPTFLRAYRARSCLPAPVVCTSSGPLPAEVDLAQLADAVLPAPFELDRLLTVVTRFAPPAPT